MRQKDVSYAKDWISGQRLMVPLSFRIWVFATWCWLSNGAGNGSDVNWS